MIRTLSLLLILGISIAVNPGVQKPKLSESDLTAVTQAIEDEIYDYGYQKNFYQMGEQMGTSRAPRTRMRVYIQPEVELRNGEGRVIYKLMPIGEVLREFATNKDGLVVLSGNPQVGFPPTQESSTKTVYMDDDEVCKMKHDWLKSFFEVDDLPSPERIAEAVRRQKLRTGFSDWEYRQSRK